jgi:hypothetical protein
VSGTHHHNARGERLDVSLHDIYQQAETLGEHVNRV